jgi:hypothetical protein
LNRKRSYWAAAIQGNSWARKYGRLLRSKCLSRNGWVRGELPLKFPHSHVFQPHPPGIGKLHQDGEDIRENEVTVCHGFL